MWAKHIIFWSDVLVFSEYYWGLGSWDFLHVLPYHTIRSIFLESDRMPSSPSWSSIRLNREERTHCSLLLSWHSTSVLWAARTGAVLPATWAAAWSATGARFYLLQTVYFIGQQHHHAQLGAFVRDFQDLGLHVLQWHELETIGLFHHLHRFACFLQ